MKKVLPSPEGYARIHTLVHKHRLHTVCREAACPNQWECGAMNTATFLILGPHCTRGCRFCNIIRKAPAPPDPEEPERVAQAAKDMGLSYVVVTSVTRDDLPDGGASMFSEIISALRLKIPGVRVEVLIPDFRGNPDSLETVVAARPDVMNHNVETVPRLYPAVRPEADYRRSIDVLRRIAMLDPRIATKSGMMLGMSEKKDETERVILELADAGCSLFTAGQYLAPSTSHLPVFRYVHPAEFASWQAFAIEAGFAAAAAGPFVRSSYQAEKMFLSARFDLA